MLKKHIRIHQTKKCTGWMSMVGNGNGIDLSEITKNLIFIQSFESHKIEKGRLAYFRLGQIHANYNISALHLFMTNCRN